MDIDICTYVKRQYTLHGTETRQNIYGDFEKRKIVAIDIDDQEQNQIL